MVQQPCSAPQISIDKLLIYNMNKEVCEASMHMNFFHISECMKLILSLLKV